MSISIIDEVRIRRWKHHTRFCANIGICPACWAKLERLLKELLGDDIVLDGEPGECIILPLKRRLTLEQEEIVADVINDKIAVCHVDHHLY